MDDSSSDKVQSNKRTLTRKEQLHEEWFALYGQFDDFMKQTPQKHPLYEFAQAAMRPNEQCDFYRGNYEALAKCLQLIEVSKNAAAQESEANHGQPVDWENMYVDMLRLLIGLSMSRALKRWPDENMPRGAFEQEQNQQQ